MPTNREQQRDQTMRRIVAASRTLLTGKGAMTLRAVAHEVGMTPPALYRYVDSHEQLLQLVAFDVDRSATERLAAARDTQAADDPAAQLIAAAVAFRTWALAEKSEFHLVFTNPEVEQSELMQTQSASGLMFHELLFRVWEKYQFPFPATGTLEPGLLEILCQPLIPIDMTDVPEDMLGLIWLFMRSWVALYGVVTLEVYGHLDPRVIENGMMFRAMFEDQAKILGLTDELPRLRPLIDELLAG